MNDFEQIGSHEWMIPIKPNIRANKQQYTVQVTKKHVKIGLEEETFGAFRIREKRKEFGQRTLGSNSFRLGFCSGRRIRRTKGRNSTNTNLIQRDMSWVCGVR